MEGIARRATGVATLLTYVQASQLLGVKVNTLYAWVSRRVIPFVRLSPRVVRFRREDLEAWIIASHVPPNARAREDGSTAPAPPADSPR